MHEVKDCSVIDRRGSGVIKQSKIVRSVKTIANKWLSDEGTKLKQKRNCHVITILGKKKIR